MAKRVSLPTTTPETEPYIEEYARSKRVRAGQKGHTQYVEIYSDGSGTPTSDETFRLYAVGTSVRAFRQEAESA